MTAFYNEIDPYAAQWLRNLIAAGHIASGVVDERSIVDLDPDELRQYTQCHFFAGIGVWSHALRLAGIPDSRSLWTGSCPCQPFSAAGKGEGHQDERHLWPAWHRLIRECKPATVFGEQVASADGRAWLDVVCTDMEDDHYAIGAADLSAAGVGAPHIRQRLFFVAHAGQEQRGRRAHEREPGRQDATERIEAAIHDQRRSSAGLMAHADGGITSEGSDGGLAGLQRGGEYGLLAQGGRSGLMAHAERGATERRRFDVGSAEGCTEVEARERQRVWAESGAGGDAGLMGNANDTRLEGRGLLRERAGERAAGPAGLAGFWSACDWLPCRDGKSRPVEPKYVALVDGAPGDLGLVRSCEESEEVDAPQIDRDGGDGVRAVRQDGLQTACPPSGRELGERQPVELADFVRLLPSSLALAELHGDTATTDRLRALLEASGAQGLVQYAPDALEAAWRSLGEEGQDRFRLAVEAGAWMRTVEFPLAHGAPARVGRLRAYGNAIVAPVAAEFIRAAMT